MTERMLITDRMVRKYRAKDISRLKAGSPPMRAGDALVFHGEIYHHTPPNRTDKRRRAIQYHYSSAKCQRNNDETPYFIEPEFLVAGKP